MATTIKIATTLAVVLPAAIDSTVFGSLKIRSKPGTPETRTLETEERLDGLRLDDAQKS